MPARRPVSTLNEIGMGRALKTISSVSKTCTVTLLSTILMDERSWKQRLDEVKEDLNEVHNHLNIWPNIFLRDLIPMAIKTMDDVLHSYEYDHYDNTEKYQEMSNTLLRTVLFECLEELDTRFLVSDFTRNSILHNLQYLPNLISLKLSSFINPTFIVALPETLSNIHHLEIFDCGSNCNDEIVEILSLHCSGLRMLKICMSIGVTDRSVEYITKLTQLEFLDIMYTCITAQGYRQIVYSLSNLRNIAWEEQIEYVVSNATAGRFYRINKFCGVVRLARTLRLQFRNIKYLVLAESGLRDMTPLSDLLELEYLRLTGFHYAICNAGHALPGFGPRLLDLYFDGISQLNICDVINNCVLLRTLSIKRCTFFDAEMQVTETDLPHFDSLTTLRIHHNTGASWYNMNVLHYTNLQVLDARCVEEFNDQYFSTAIADGHFRNLTHFMIHTAFLSRSTADLLLQNCANLSHLGALETWIRIGESDEENIKALINRNNYDVKLLKYQEIRKIRHLSTEHYFYIP